MKNNKAVYVVLFPAMILIAFNIFSFIKYLGQEENVWGNWKTYTFIAGLSILIIIWAAILKQLFKNKSANSKK